MRRERRLERNTGGYSRSGACNIRGMDDGAFPATEPDNALPAIAEAIKEVPPAPCDGCVHASRCALESLACLTFIEYFNSRHGCYNPDALRMPTSAIYNRAFGVGRVCAGNC